MHIECKKKILMHKEGKQKDELMHTWSKTSSKHMATREK